jgi:hypothetical protein
LLDDCNHCLRTYRNEQLVLDGTSKCLYVTNSKNGRMTECSKDDEQINHYIHFKVFDSKYICIKNNVDPEDRYFDGNTFKKKSESE